MENIITSFTITSGNIFTNLHNIAVEHAAKVVHMSAGSGTINQFIINSAICDDGKTIANKEDNSDFTKRFGDGKYEVGIVLECNDMKNQKLTDKETDQKKIEKDNEKIIENTRKLALQGINEYFNWFVGEKNKFTEGDLVEFVPDYNGGRVQVKNGEIIGIDVGVYRKDKIETKDVLGNPVITYVINKIGEKTEEKIRLGFKVGYTISKE